MEARIVLGCVAFVAAFASAFLFARLALATGERLARNRKALGLRGDSLLESLFRNGFQPLIGVSGFALRWQPVGKLLDPVSRALAWKGYGSEPAPLLSLAVAIVLALLVVGSLLAGSPVFGVAVACCFLLGVRLWAKQVHERRSERFREEIPEAVRTMQACFSVGYSLQQTLRQVANQGKGPLADLFLEASSILEAGGSVSRALAFIKEDSRDPDLVFLATALEIQHRTGSSMHQILEVARESIEDELSLRRTLRTQTAQARLSARIVTIMPFFLVALFSLVSEGFLAPFFESVLGLVLLAIALTMQVAGVLMVRKMLKVEVV